MNNLQLVLGGPGCGKTTRLLDIVQMEMERGVPSRAIAMVTFNKDASDRARARAAAKFNLNPKTDLPWFRTIHSLAYGLMNVQRDEMMEMRDWAEFSEVVGETITGVYSTDEAPEFTSIREMGNTMLRLVDYSRTTMMTLLDAWHALDEIVDWYRLKRFAEALESYKADTGKMDFTDLLSAYIKDGKPVNVQVAVIDEAQDLTRAQWAVVRKAFAGAERVYVAGDDDQAIYYWAGADVPQFLTLHEQPEVLSLSHRLPRTVHSFSQRVAQRIDQRYAKQFRPSDREGAIEWHQHVQGIDFSEGTWFILARNNYLLRPVEALIRGEGWNYTRRAGPSVSPTDVKTMLLWERLRSGKVPDMSAAEFRHLNKMLERPKPQTRESKRYTLRDLYPEHLEQLPPWYEALTGIPDERRDFYLACLRRGEKIAQKPRIRIETIHGVKGDEADHVVLMTDMSHRTAMNYRKGGDFADNEHRVFYVGVTRCLQSLHMVAPQSDMFYEFP